MALSSITVVKEVLRRVNGFAGAQPAVTETNWGVTSLTTTQADSPIYNLSFIRDVVADVAARIALEIASVPDTVTGIGSHPWRTYFASETANLNNGDSMPTVDSSNVPI